MITIKLVFIKEESISFIFPEYFTHLNWEAIFDAVLKIYKMTFRDTPTTNIILFEKKILFEEEKFFLKNI